MNRLPMHDNFNLSWRINKSTTFLRAAASKAETTIADFHFEAGILRYNNNPVLSIISESGAKSENRWAHQE